MSKQPDIAPKTLPNYVWTEQAAEDSLGKLYGYVSERGQDAIKWYLAARQSRKFLAGVIRISAIVFTALAGLTPILQGIVASVPTSQTASVPIVGIQLLRAPAWSSVFLGVAAALVLLDRFFGYSAAWMRYMDTQMRIARILDDFSLDWEMKRLGWANRAPTQEELQQMLGLAKSCLTQIDTAIHAETGTWVEEFRDAIKQIDSSTIKTGAPAASGVVKLLISNGDKCEAGWKLAVDSGRESQQQGKSATVPGLSPGVHHFDVSGVINGTAVQGSVSATVAAGATAEASITLQ